MSTFSMVIVTGVSSFVGMHLACYLAKQGHEIIGTYTQPQTAYPSLQTTRLNQAQKASVKLVQLDITDPNQIKKLIDQTSPTIWFHHAGWAKDYASKTYDIKKGQQINVAPLETLYESLAHQQAKGIIITGTNAEYTPSDEALTEDSPCEPTTPYGQSKLAETRRAAELAEQYQLKTRVTRLFIPYGAYDNPKKLLPTLVQALQNGQSIDLSPCEQIRDFLYVQDVVRGFEALMNDCSRKPLFDIFNLCAGQPIVLKEFLLQIATCLEADKNLLQFGKIPIRETETPISYGSNQKAQKILHWQPQALDASIKDYINTFS